MQNTLHDTVGYTYSPSVSIESAVPDSMDKLLQRLVVKVGDDSVSNYMGELAEQSLGGINLIYLALKLLEYEVKLSSDRVAHFLLIEEPEAHIHTHIQKTLFENHAAQKTQTIVSTHSTHISSAAKIQSVNVLLRRKDYVDVCQPSKGLSGDETNRVERYLDAVRSTLLFAKGVILVEGESELIMIPAMIKAVFGLSADELGISVIAMGSAFFGHIGIVFHEERIKRRCSIVTDLDISLIELPGNPEADNEDQRHARAAQDSGKYRRNNLNSLTDGNTMVRVFFAEHTFELDFLFAQNAREVRETVDEVYSSDVHREQIKTDLSFQNKEIAGKAVLRLANKLGKGWFSLLLSEKCRADTVIPEYILRALAFAIHEISADSIKRMGIFRLANEFYNNDTRQQFPEINILKQLSAQDFINLYKKTAPDDILSLFIGYLEEYR